ncbi:MAG: NUDIX domain-containing protein [Nanoarchaeota archaeon]
MKHPKVGVQVIIKRDGKVLLGKRKGLRGGGTWCFPGGHLEFYEQIEDCARRETREETGIEIKNLREGPFTNDISKKERIHYITLYLIADYARGEPRVREPKNFEKWEWFSWDNLPKLLLIPVKNLLAKKFNPFLPR